MQKPQTPHHVNFNTTPCKSLHFNALQTLSNVKFNMQGFNISLYKQEPHKYF